MKINFIHGDIITQLGITPLVYCIDSSFTMDSEIDKKINMKDMILAFYDKREREVGNCIYEKGVMHLITRYTNTSKPTYTIIEECLLSLRSNVIHNNITEICFPLIEAGQSTLDFNKTFNLIENIFSHMAITIDIYYTVENKHLIEKTMNSYVRVAESA